MSLSSMLSSLDQAITFKELLMLVIVLVGTWYFVMLYRVYRFDKKLNEKKYL